MKHILTILILAVMVVAGGGALAQDEIVSVRGLERLRAEQISEYDRQQALLDDVLKRRGELENVQQHLAQSQLQRARLEEQIKALQGDRIALSAELIATTKRVSTLEKEVTQVEVRLSGLLRDENNINQRLRDKQAELSSLIGALQRITKNPPPALVINPQNALDGARSGMMLKAVMPHIQIASQAIRQDLSRLRAIKTRIEEEKAELVNKFQRREADKLRISLLLQVRTKALGESEKSLEKSALMADQLAKNAQSLNDFINQLETRIEPIRKARRAARSTLGLPSPASRNRARRILAEAAPDRDKPAIDFLRMAGLMTLPVNGVRVLEFNEPDGFGARSKGIYVITRPKAQITAPADGWVLFKGDYLDFGQVVLMDMGTEHLLLLAGMGNTQVELGQFVLRGEPLGEMGSRTVAPDLITKTGASRPTLYIELRKNGREVQTTNWWLG